MTLVRLKVRHVRVVNFQAVTIYLEGVTGAVNLFLSKLNPEGTIRYPLEYPWYQVLSKLIKTE